MHTIKTKEAIENTTGNHEFVAIDATIFDIQLHSKFTATKDFRFLIIWNVPR